MRKGCLTGAAPRRLLFDIGEATRRVSMTVGLSALVCQKSKVFLRFLAGWGRITVL